MLQGLLTSQIDTFIFPGLGTKQSKCPPSGNDIVPCHYSISGGQLIVGLHSGQYAEPLLDYSDHGLDQVTLVWEHHFQWNNRCTLRS